MRRSLWEALNLIKITLADQNLNREELHALITEFYILQGSLFPTGVGENITLEDATNDFWREFDTYFPPTGVIALAHDADEKLLGCGMMRKIRPDAAEFKRMFVRPEGRGQGIGRMLVERRMEVAKEMGITAIYADTLTASTTMHEMYRDLGFKQIARYPESHTVEHFPELEELLIYFHKDL